MEYLEQIQDTEFDEALKSKLIQYVKVCLDKNVPVIFNLYHFAHEISITLKILRRMVNSSHSFYYEFEIPKRSGGKRKIAAPYPSLAYVQRWIVENIMDKFIPHKAATAYQARKSIINHAKPHEKHEYVLIIDLKDYFPSIKLDRVKRMFERIGYPDHISYFFAKLCVLNGTLPQGAPSSPIISNFITYDLDLLVSRFSIANHLVFTRYADDMCISARYDFADKHKEIIEIIEGNGFRVNTKKLRYIKGFGKKKIITGISIGSGKIKLPRGTKRKWRIEMHQILHYGIDHHLEHHNIKDPIYLNRCIGKMYYWKMIEPHNQFVLKTIKELEKLNAGNTAPPSSRR